MTREDWAGESGFPMTYAATSDGGGAPAATTILYVQLELGGHDGDGSDDDEHRANVCRHK